MLVQITHDQVVLVQPLDSIYIYSIYMYFLLWAKPIYSKVKEM